MTCDRARGLLPLFVEGDLPASDAAPLAGHLAGCPTCRREERLFRESQAFWKEAPAPLFDEPFHADVRRAVRARIDTGEAVRRRGWAGVRAWGLLAGATAALTIGFLVPERPRPEPRSTARVTPVPDAVTSPLAVAVSAPAAVTPRVRLAAAPAVRPRMPRRRETSLVVARVTRVEITTPNPHVRIIWLANASEAAPI